uniref:Pachytene checkpoint protein 2 homolog n=1 Tax=Piliocolobus tephrosceles TaxID=591936 RepID=A0A8C9G9S6_9PRIM
MNLNEKERIPLCCEICLKNEKDVSNETIRIAAHKWLFSLGITITLGRHDPNKINCEDLNKNCDYIVIEPAIPIKIVKEINWNYKNTTCEQLQTTHYSVYEVNSDYNISDNINASLIDDLNTNHIDNHNTNPIGNFNANTTESLRANSIENSNTSSSSDNINETTKKRNINDLTFQQENAKVNFKYDNSFSCKKKDLLNGLNTNSLVSSSVCSKTSVRCSSSVNDHIENTKNDTKHTTKLLFTVPVIGEKSISSMEEDPIILPNFCCIVNVVTYYKNDDIIEDQYNEPSEDEEEEEEGKKKKSVPIYSQYILPHLRFHKLWDCLYYEENIKRDLLEYVSALMLFANKKIDCNLINYNHLVLLYGPPGTGKTSLCKALANKICIRLSNIYTTGILIELNTHTLFSKWFSESGKQVLKLFNKIKRIIHAYGENDIFICLLIDEVESLSADRKKSIDKTEPSDTIRVVNTLLTQIDSLKYYHNTLILTTSNISEMLDGAFIDRVDLKQFIGLPNEECRYEIYKDSINELIEKGIISFTSNIPNYQRIQSLLKNENNKSQNECMYGCELLKCADMSDGFSGRCLRRIPFQAYAYFCQATLRFYNSTNNNNKQNFQITISEFFLALKKAIQKEIVNKKNLQEKIL